MAVASSPNGPASRVALDWVYIRTRTLWLLGVMVLLAVAAGAWWWMSADPRSLEEQAVQAISRAENLLAQAQAVAPGADNLSLAREHITRGREALDVGQFTRAIDEAQAAETLSRELLSGGDVTDTGVRVARSDGDVRIKRSGQFMWEPATERTMLSMGDQIRTGSNGSAQLIFFDGTMMTVQPGTLLEIRELYRDSERREHRVSERLKWGSLKASTQETAGVRGVHEVSTSSAAVRAEHDAEFLVAHDREKGRSEVTALRGAVRLQTSEDEVTLNESTRVTLSKGRVVETTNVLAPPLLKDPPDQRTFLAPRESQVRLSWLRLDRAEYYHLQVSERPMFSRSSVEIDAVRSEQTTLPPLSPGSYYWRVAGIDANGYEGRWSDTRKFRILGAKFQDPDDKVPPILEVSEILVVGTNAIISGRSEPGALVWIAGERVDMDESGAFTWVIKLHRDGENRIAFQAQDAAGNETNRVGYAFVDVF